MTCCKHFVYILRCSDNSLYTGYTVDISRRLQEHNTGKRGAKYTRSRRPCVLVYTEEFSSKSDALRRECSIKKMSKLEKERLVSKYNARCR